MIRASSHYWGALNGGDYQYVVLKDSFYNGLEALYEALGGVTPLYVTDGYRNPRHNAGTRYNSPTSRH
ncbi:MAG TPA: hypothetical protein PLL10_05880, partial [Elusimicrobiales bacterium]|nr:hypothetical protein [Elusimicrobiales bacterium]